MEVATAKQKIKKKIILLCRKSYCFGQILMSFKIILEWPQRIEDDSQLPGIP